LNRQKKKALLKKISCSSKSCSK